MKLLPIILCLIAAPGMASRHPDRMVRSDIEVNYSFNRGGLDSRDLTGTSGTAAGNAVVTAGNRYLTLDGTGDWVTTTDAAGLDVGDDFSVSVWVRPNAPGTGATRVPVGRYDAANNKRSWLVSLRYSDTPQRMFAVVGTGAAVPVVYAFNMTLPTSGWHHVVMVYDNAAGTGLRCKLYYDGASVALSTTLSDSATSPFATDIGVRIGNDNDGTSATAWKGDVDEVRIYNRALTTAEAAAIYSSEKGEHP